MSDLPIEPDAGALRIVAGCDQRPEIVITDELADVADEGAKHLGRDGEIYQRGGSLVHVVTPTTPPGMRSSPVIRELGLATLGVRLSQVARWLKLDKRSERYRRVQPPASIVHTIHERGQWDSVRPLVGVITAPTLRVDGSVLQEAGYDPPSGLLLWPSLAYAGVPEAPTLEDAKTAAKAIADLVVDFPFATRADRAAWLAGVLTMVARHSIIGPCPLFAVDGNTRASGKSLLADVASMLAFGVRAARTVLSRNEEEIRKQLTSLLSEGVASALIDNVQSGGRFGGPAFDALLTSDVWKDRVLGEISTVTLPARTVWWATCNNFRFLGDLPRRTLRIRLESPLEDPEHREGFKHGKGDALVELTANRRRFLVTQALIILRAHILAGRPACGPTWGSFEAWTRAIADPIRWLGGTDPLEARATVDEGADEDRLFAAAVLRAMLVVERPLSARELVDELYPRGFYDGDRPPDPSPTYAGAREALEAATGAKGTPNTLHVGHFLRRMRGRVIEGHALTPVVDAHLKIHRWTAKKIGA